MMQQRQILSQIEHGPKFCHGRLSGADLGGRRAGLEPVGQGVLARASSRRAEQFKQRARAEQIDVRRVGMPLVEEATAGLALAFPFVGQTLLSGGVVGDRTPRPLPGTQHDIMHEQQGDEERQQQSQPPRRKLIDPQPQEQHQQHGPGRREAEEAHELFLPGEGFGAALAVLAAVLVLAGGIKTGHGVS